MNTLRRASMASGIALLSLLVVMVVILGLGATPLQAEEQAGPIKILAIGDSITYGYWAYDPGRGTNSPPQCDEGNQIPEGYSRACKGTEVPGNKVNEPKFTKYASYRLPLYQLFELAGNTSVDMRFVGTVDEAAEKTYNLPNDDPDGVETVPIEGYPPEDKKCGSDAKCYPRPTAAQIAFVGWPGKTAEAVSKNADSPLFGLTPALTALGSSNRPDIALVHLGTNDITTRGALNVDSLWTQKLMPALNLIRTKLNDNASPTEPISIYFARIIPVGYPGRAKCALGGYTFAPNVAGKNFCESFYYDPGATNIVQQINVKMDAWCGREPVPNNPLVFKCNNLTAGNATVYLVDHYTHFVEGEGSGGYSQLLWLIPSDAVHPNRRGECELARVWYDAIADTHPDLGSLLPVPNQFCDAYGERYETPIEDEVCEPVPGNLVNNFCFARGRAEWRFRARGQGTFTTPLDDTYGGPYSAVVTVNHAGGNLQLLQSGIALEPNTTYELSFGAYSSDGRDMSVWIHQHGAPYTNYGLNEHKVQLQTSWQTYHLVFTTPDLAEMGNARLRFWFKPFAHAGTVYHIDNVVLRAVP